MGTRGLRIVCFRGRYFVYYNQYDSYPEVFGESVAGRVPDDPQEYKGIPKIFSGLTSGLTLSLARMA